MGRELELWFENDKSLIILKAGFEKTK